MKEVEKIYNLTLAKAGGDYAAAKLFLENWAAMPGMGITSGDVLAAVQAHHELSTAIELEGKVFAEITHLGERAGIFWRRGYIWMRLSDVVESRALPSLPSEAKPKVMTLWGADEDAGLRWIQVPEKEKFWRIEDIGTSVIVRAATTQKAIEKAIDAGYVCVWESPAVTLIGDDMPDVLQC